MRAQHSIKKMLTGSLRLTLAGGALWLAISSVSLYDSVQLRDGARISGRIHETNGGLLVRRGDGETRLVAMNEVARDTQGNICVAYGLRSVCQNSAAGLLLAAVVVFLAVPLLQAARLRYLLRAEGTEMDWPASVRLAFVGNFLNFAAPLGSTAGDVYKAYDAARHTRRKTEAAATVFIDRAIGLGTLLVSVGLIAALAAADSRLAPLRAYVLSLVGLMTIGGVVWFSPAIRGWDIVRRLSARLPLSDQLRRIDSTARTLFTRPRVLLAAIGMTLALQIAAAAAFVCVAAGLGLRVNDASPLDLYAYFSAGELVKALPGPPQGLGTMELAYTYLFTGLGGAAQIVSAAFAIRLVNLVCSLPGIVLLMVGRRAAPGKAARIAPAALGGAPAMTTS